MKYTVYTYVDRAGDTLYVGYTWNFAVRNQVHKSASPWFDLVDDVITEDYPDRDEALDREVELIAELTPKFNIKKDRTNRYGPDRETRPVSFRLTDDGDRLLSDIASRQDISRTATLEVLIREAAERSEKP